MLVASVAFCAGAFVVQPDLWMVAAALGCALRRPARAAGLALALGLVRASLAPAPCTALPAGETEALVEPGGVLRVGAARVLARLDTPLNRGDLVRVEVTAHVPPPRLNPGGRDRRADLAARGIGLEGSAHVVSVVRRGAWFWRAIDDLRARFVRRAEALCTTRDRAALVSALAVGDRSLLSREADDDLSASGLIHLLASSGLHLAVVALLARRVARRLWLRTRWAAPVRASAIAAACALPVCAAEVLLLGAPWPAVRAGTGAALALCAAMLARRRDPLTSLFLGAAVCALLDPAATHDLALQLSVTGIAGLVLLARPLRDRLPLRHLPPGARWPARLLEHVVQLGCATAAAAIATAPLLAASFHRVSLVGVFANALALLPGLAAIPVCTALVVLDWLPLWFVADGLAGFTLRAAELFASLPFATVWLATPGVVAVALWYTGAAQLARRRRWAVAPWAVLGLLALVREARARAVERVRITFLAVGQGDCALVQLPFGHALLVDGGGDLRGEKRFDPGARDILPAFAELGVHRLDAVVLTHPHPDHAGGLATVLEKIPVDELWMYPSSEPIARELRRHAARVVLPHPLQAGDARVEVLSHHDPRKSLNDDSVVLRVSQGGARALLAGDIEALSELELLGSDLRADLLKAPHHGSRTSSTDAFLRAVGAANVVYSVGAGNPFGFPHPDVVARTEALGARTFRTDQGAVFAESDGSRFSITQPAMR